MPQREFVILYVAAPLAVALAWLLWRARFFIRNFVLYLLAVAALLAIIRLGYIAWNTWERVVVGSRAEESAPVCIDVRPPLTRFPKGDCWI